VNQTHEQMYMEAVPAFWRQAGLACAYKWVAHGRPRDEMVYIYRLALPSYLVLRSKCIFSHKHTLALADAIDQATTATTKQGERIHYK